jgi:hypothetical protein
MGSFAMTGTSSIGIKGCLTVSLVILVLGLPAVSSFSAGLASSPAHAASASEIAMRPLVDRTHKSDRLDGPAAAARKILKSRPVRLIEGCEPLVSPYVDPALARIPGRCFA